MFTELDVDRRVELLRDPPPPMPDDRVIESAIELRDCRGYIRLGIWAMQETGAAARTMAALYELADRRTRSTRVSIARISELCGLPRRTVQRHLGLLENRWLAIKTRQTRGASYYSIAPFAWDARLKYVAMPLWWRGVSRDLQAWATTATYCWLLSRACLCEYLEIEDGEAVEDRLFVTQRKIADDTGLNRKSVCQALSRLAEANLIDRSTGGPWDPVFDFRMSPLKVTPKHTFKGGAQGKSGARIPIQRDPKKKNPHTPKRAAAAARPLRVDAALKSGNARLRIRVRRDPPSRPALRGLLRRASAGYQPAPLVVVLTRQMYMSAHR